MKFWKKQKFCFGKNLVALFLPKQKVFKKKKKFGQNPAKKFLVILLYSEEAHLCHSRMPVLKCKHVEGEHLADKTQVFLPTGGMVWLGGKDMAGLRRVKESIRGGVELSKGGRQEVEKIKP